MSPTGSNVHLEGDLRLISFQPISSIMLTYFVYAR